MVAGAILFAQHAKAIEDSTSPTPQDVAAHRAYVVSTILQAAAAIETEWNEICEHGPRHHLGGVTNFMELARRQDLWAKRRRLQVGQVADRWNHLLEALGAEPFESDDPLYKDIELLGHLRNEIVHYRSAWGGATEKADLFARLQARGLALTLPAAFDDAARFPHGIINSRCANWCATTAVTCMDAVGQRLGVDSVLAGHRLPGADLAPILLAARPVPHA